MLTMERSAEATGLDLFDRHVQIPVTAPLGNVAVTTNIRSSFGQLNMLPEYRICYPKTVIQALGQLYAEYNRAFGPLVEANKEWPTDYQKCRLKDGSPVNFAVQIDMVGLPDSFLQVAADMPVDELREILRRRVFEVENSLAVYQLLQKLFARGTEPSVFDERFRSFLAKIRAQFGMPIALLAVTDQKYEAMKSSEFGKGQGEDLSAAEVMELSGFDHFFSPAGFREHVMQNGGKCQYLLYARTSDPVEKLKKPALVVEQPLLSDPDMRRIIKEYALTFNIDAPGMSPEQRINDTKGYMHALGMALPIQSEAELFSSECMAHLSSGKKYTEFPDGRLSSEFAGYLKMHGVDPKAVEAGTAGLRCKPLQGAYGCYGHVTGFLPNGEFRRDLRRDLKQRGRYVIQPEMKVPRITNSTNGIEYCYIDRNFVGLDDGQVRFLGGFRSLMPVQSVETHAGRNHGNALAVFGEIA